MSAEEFRRHGRVVVDWIADYSCASNGSRSSPIGGRTHRELPAAPPEVGEPMEQIIADVDRLVVPALTQWSHPAFFAYFATSTSAPGIFGRDALGCLRRARRCSGARRPPRRNSKKSPCRGCAR